MSTEASGLREGEVEIPETDELLWRQIHPGFVDGDQVSKQAFYPAPSDDDDGELSVNRESIVTAKDAYEYYTQELNLQSVGVQSLTVREVISHQLRIVDDSNTPHDTPPGHTYIDFKLIDARKRREKIGSKLRDQAMARGWQYRP